MLEFRNYLILKAGEQSEFLIFAPRFAVVNEIDGTVILMFVVQNNQVVFNTAIISKALIQEIILGMNMRSPAVDSQGRPLLEINVPAGKLVFRSEDEDPPLFSPVAHALPCWCHLDRYTTPFRTHLLHQSCSVDKHIDLAAA